MSTDALNGFEDDKKKKNDEFAPTYTWQQVWTMALTRPATATFEAILNDPMASARRGITWVFWTGTVAMIGSQILRSMAYANFGMRLSVPSLACTLVLGGVFTVIAFVLMSGLLHLIAKLFGGKGTFGQFQYAYAASYAPLMMVNLLLTPFTASTALSLLNIVLFFYSYLLGGMALRATNGFGWAKAIGVLVVHFVIMVAIAFAIVSYFINVLYNTNMSF